MNYLAKLISRSGHREYPIVESVLTTEIAFNKKEKQKKKKKRKTVKKR